LRRFFGWLFKPLRRRAKQQDTDQPEANFQVTDEGAFDEPEVVWSESRLRLLQRLWGDGFVRCGEAEYLREFLPLLGLTEKNSILLIGAGLGGAGHMIVDETSAWVTGYENQKELADLGKQRAKMTGMTKRAPVKFSDFAALKVRAKSFDTCVSMESLYTTSDKKTALTTLAESLRSTGELWYTDFVLPSHDPPNDVVKTWSETLPHPVHLWPGTVTQTLLKTLDLDVQPPDDITRAYRMRIFKSLMTFLASTNKAELVEIVDEVFRELESLGKLIAALDSGGMKVYRFHAYKKRDTRPSAI
jgi:cyclopropane fatty-acyl-phospholipid synthase-like methyltransferase